MGYWSDGVWHWEFVWRRNLFEWEKEFLEELKFVIGQVVLIPVKVDKWSWSRVKDGNFSTRDAYKVICESRNSEGEEFFKQL